MNPICCAFVAKPLVSAKPVSVAGRPTHEGVLSIRSTKGYALTKLSLLPKDIIAMLAELKMVIHRGGIMFRLGYLFHQALLEKNSLKFNVAIVKYNSLSHELLQKISINRLEFRVLFQAVK